MYDSSDLINDFHEQHVRLGLSERQSMRSRREANLARLKSGLEELGKPAIAETINQGGYAMKTMTLPPEADTESFYDIDMGVVFEAKKVLSPKTTKDWVRDAIALKASSLKYEPESKPKCVRVTYADGYQVDFPVFKREQDGNSFRYFVALGDEWVESSPQRFNQWFESVVSTFSPELNPPYQLRKLVRLIKYYFKVRSFAEGTKFPAGLVATALAVECYSASPNRLDRAFFDAIKRLSERSEFLGVFADGALVSNDRDILRLRRMAVAAVRSVETMRPLFEIGEQQTENDAKKIWRSVFRHSCFDTDASKAMYAPETKATAGALAASLALGASPALSAPARVSLLTSAIDQVKSSPYAPQHGQSKD
jgi:Second Messenger Oligonucleotide or Dinucleotide Synthetase domain